MKLLFEASAPVRASVAEVRELIDDGWLVNTFLGGRDEYVDIDNKPGVVGFQGHWWYRGELSAGEADGRTVVTYRVYNIAKQGAWAVPLANKLFIGYRAKMREGTERLAQAIDEKAG